METASRLCFSVDLPNIEAIAQILTKRDKRIKIINQMEKHGAIGK